MEAFERSWPDGFYGSISKTVITMAATLKHIQIGNDKIFDNEIIYARAMALQSVGNLDADQLLSRELAPHPTSMFDE